MKRYVRFSEHGRILFYPQGIIIEKRISLPYRIKVPYLRKHEKKTIKNLCRTKLLKQIRF